MTSRPASPAGLEAELNAVTAAVEAGHAALAGGADVDFAGLDDRVDACCAAVLALPAAQAKEHAERLASLLRALDRLAAALGAPEARLRAVASYGSAGGLG